MSVSKALSLEMHFMTLGQDSSCCTQPSVKLKKRGTLGLPECTEVYLCVNKMKLYSYQVLEKGGEVHKKGYRRGLERMSNTSRRAWTKELRRSQKEDEKKQRGRPWGCQDNKTPKRSDSTKKSSSSLGLIHRARAEGAAGKDLSLQSQKNNWLTGREPQVLLLQNL